MHAYTVYSYTVYSYTVYSYTVYSYTVYSYTVYSYTVNSMCLIPQDYYPANEYILRQGATGDTFFIINSGTVRTHTHTHKHTLLATQTL